MKALLSSVVLLAAMLCCVSAASNIGFYFQQVQQPDNSTSNFVSVGCFCVKANATLGVTSNVSNLLDCYCLSDVTDLASNDNNTQVLNLANLLNMDLAAPAALVCTCAFPKSDSDQSNQSFLLPGYNGSSFVPVNCTCARAIDYLSTLVPPTITIPILNIDVPIPIDRNSPYENLVPLNCFCSSRFDLFDTLTVIGFNPNIPALACKCLPSISVGSGDLLIYGSAWTVPVKNVDLSNLDLTFNGFDATPILGNITDVPAGIVYPEFNLTIPILNTDIRPPPYINVVPDSFI